MIGTLWLGSGAKDLEVSRDLANLARFDTDFYFKVWCDEVDEFLHNVAKSFSLPYSSLNHVTLTSSDVKHVCLSANVKNLSNFMLPYGK